MIEIRRRVEALRKPLLFASANGFRGIARVRDLGGTLRTACDRIVEIAPAEQAGALRSWRTRLARFERLDESEQAVEVARGLRLCQVLAGPAPARRRAGRDRRGRDRDPRGGAPERGQQSPPAAADGGATGGVCAPAAIAPRPLAAPAQSLPGIGPALAEKLADRGIETVEDLLWLVPRRYDDVRRVVSLADALAAAEASAGRDRVTAAGEVRSSRFARSRRLRWVEVVLADPARRDARVVIRFFNVHGGMAARFSRGGRAVVSGRIRRRGDAWEMANPDVVAAAGADGGERTFVDGIVPRYPDIPGVPAATLRKACRAAVERASDHIADGVPARIARSQNLGSLAEALLSLHAPPPSVSPLEVARLNDGTSDWHRRLAFDELFVLALAVARRRRERRAAEAPACPQAEGAQAALPFALTGAQRRAVGAISGDLARAVPMNRLLQGDVGSGKTAVAFVAAHQVAASGRQVALMAPTELLAEQHAATLRPWLDAVGVRAALLTASTPRPVKASIASMVAAGDVGVVIGTHALLADAVAFSTLGLVIVDEQHRFGVAQRLRLRRKADEVEPHLLVMTATPIPRTLALTAYGDLDVTTIDELPPGRRAPTTRVLSGKRGRERAYRQVAARVRAGARAYVVCPLIEPSDEETGRGGADAVTTAVELADKLAPARVGLAHGRMGQAERERVMAAFRRGDLDVLVATTVIEVGVDVPEAEVMVVLDAARFGLAQLHQLRGRVGRGGGDAACLLVAERAPTPEGARRLAVMAETSDGFRIAEEDLALRGPGELFGVRQAGLPKLRFGDLRQHAALLAAARDEAEQILERDPQLASPDHAQTARVLAERTRGEAVYGPESG